MQLRILALAAAVLFSSGAISAPPAKEAPAPQRAEKGHPPFPGPHPMPGFCHGGELFCASSLSDNPTETINKLTSVIPAGKAKRYEVRVSVVELPDHPPAPPAP